MIPIRDSVPTRHFPVVNWTLIAVNAAVFLLELGLPERGLEAFFYSFGLVPAVYAMPERFPLWGPLDFAIPLLSHMFLHGGWMHFISNMWVLHIFGDNVEDSLGKVRYLGFYILGGLAAAGLQTAVSWGSPVPLIGASGAIAAVMGAYFLLHPFGRVLTLVPVIFYAEFVELPAFVFMGLWMFSQLYSGTVAVLAGAEGFGGVAWWAHVGGFVGGVLLLPVLLRRKSRTPTLFRK